MPLNAHSIQYKIAIVTIWIFPFLVIAGFTRDWVLWFTRILSSVWSVFLFALSFLLFMLIHIDFENMRRMHMTLQEMVQRSFSGTVFFFPGLALVIVLGVLTAIFRLGVPSIFLVGFLALAFHVLYLMSVIILASQ